MAAPTKLNAQTIDQMIDIAQRGGFITELAAAAAVTEQTIRNWRERGNDALTRDSLGIPLNPDDILYLDLVTRLEIAWANVELTMGERIIQAAEQGEWRAATWWIDRRDRIRAADQARTTADPDTTISKLERILADYKATQPQGIPNG